LSMGWRTGFGCDDCSGIRLCVGSGAVGAQGQIPLVLRATHDDGGPNLVKLVFVSAFW